MKTMNTIFYCAIFMFGCYQSRDESEVQTKNYLINVDMTNSGDFSAVLPDGTFYNDMESFNENMEPTYEQLADEGTDIQFEFGDNIQEQLDIDLVNFIPSHTDDSSDCNSKDGLQTIVSPLYIGGGYNLTTSFGWKYIAGCIKRNVYRLAIHLNKYSYQVFDLHAAFYRESGKVCFGLYESVSGWKSCNCNPTYSQIKGWVVEVAIVAGVSVGVATIIANIVTPLIFMMAI